MTETRAERKELRRLVLDGWSHEDIVAKVGFEGESTLKTLATLPIRRPSWWERGLAGGLVFLWALLTLASGLEVTFGLPEVPLGWLIWTAIALVICVQLFRGNGSVYGPSIALLLADVVWMWTETSPEDAYAVQESLWITLFIVAICGAAARATAVAVRANGDRFEAAARAALIRAAEQRIRGACVTISA